MKINPDDIAIKITMTCPKCQSTGFMRINKVTERACPNCLGVVDRKFSTDISFKQFLELIKEHLTQES